MKNIYFLALATFVVSLAACTKEIQPATKSGNSDARDVLLKIEVPSSRAITDAVTTTTVNVDSMALYFYDYESGVIYYGDVYMPTDTVYTKAITEAGCPFYTLNSNVNSVVVVINPPAFGVEVGDNISTIKNYSLDASDQQTFSNVLFYGQDENFPITSVGTSSTFSTVSLSVKPLVARVEISAIACSDQGTLYDTIPLTGIYLDNVYSSVLLSTAVADGLTTYTSTTIPTASQWNVDILTTPQDITSTAWSPNTDEVFAYQFIPGDELPYLRLGFTNLTTTADATVASRWLLAKSYSGITAFEAGYIYRLTCTFTEADLTTFIALPSTVNVALTVSEWTLETSTTPQW